MITVHRVQSQLSLLTTDQEKNESRREYGSFVVEVHNNRNGISNEEGYFSTNTHQDQNKICKLTYITCIAAIGGFLSGYNTGVISGALLPMKRVFYLNQIQEELLVSCTIGGACVASFVGGLMNNALGRKYTIMLAAFIFTFGSAIMCLSQNYAWLLIGEVALGFGIGIESLTSPMYISEIALPNIRGLLVTLYSVFMVIGQLFAGIVNGVLSQFQWNWRYAFLIECLPGIVMFIGFISLPESPSWLIANNSIGEARYVLSSIRDTKEEVDLEIFDIQNSIRNTGAYISSSSLWANVYSMMTYAPTRKSIIVGCGLMILQQFCGINTVLYYASSIFEMAGFDENASIWLGCFTATAQIFGQAISVCMVEKAGRRNLILVSLFSVAVMAIGLGVSFFYARVYSEPVHLNFSDAECSAISSLVWDGITSYCYDCTKIEGCGFLSDKNVCVRGNIDGPFEHRNGNDNNQSVWTYSTCSNRLGWMSVFFMFLYVFVFGIGMGGLPWTINSEIYPYQYRSLAVSISTSTNWIGNWILSSSFLTLSSPNVLTLYGIFMVYSFICFIGCLWLYIVLPETKGLSVDMIEKQFSTTTTTCSLTKSVSLDSILDE